MKTRFLMTAALFTAGASAHDIESKPQIVPPAVIVRSTYGGTDPVPYSPVLIYGPGGGKTEYQNGRTDANGGFSFLPDRNGEWLFILDDELGHRQELRIQVTLHGGPNINSAASLSRGQKLLIGLAMILGTTGLFSWWKTREMLAETRR